MRDRMTMAISVEEVLNFETDVDDRRAECLCLVLPAKEGAIEETEAYSI